MQVLSRDPVEELGRFELGGHLMRRFTGLVVVLTISCGMIPAASQPMHVARERIKIDRRTYAEKPSYQITIVAEDGELGHAFVIWSQEDDKKRMSTQEATGFYPQSDKNNVRALFGQERGRIFDDIRERRDIQVDVIVNSDAYERSRSVYARWKAEGRYVLGFSDCTTYVSEVARAAGIPVPDRMFAPYPIDFVRGIIKLDEPDRADRLEKQARKADQAAGAARERAARAHRLAERARRRRRDLADEAAWTAIRNIRSAIEMGSQMDAYGGAVERQLRIEGRENALADREEARAASLRAQKPILAPTPPAGDAPKPEPSGSIQLRKP